jgi:hypothetical protein
MSVALNAEQQSPETVANSHSYVESHIVAIDIHATVRSHKLSIGSGQHINGGLECRHKRTSREDIGGRSRQVVSSQLCNLKKSLAHDQVTGIDSGHLKHPWGLMPRFSLIRSELVSVRSLINEAPNA